jgi:hypothetical protein
MKTELELVMECNELAGEFYSIMGYKCRKGFRFDLSCHPQELMCWHMAALAYERLRDTDMNNALAEIGE